MYEANTKVELIRRETRNACVILRRSQLPIFLENEAELRMDTVAETSFCCGSNIGSNGAGYNGATVSHS